ncbi:MTMR4 protein, partial [Amia calva]|nr:MTMR4 protein [Amia calva]
MRTLLLCKVSTDRHSTSSVVCKMSVDPPYIPLLNFLVAPSEGEEGPPSLEYIQAKDLFPHKELVKEEESLQVPFPVLQGEGVEYLGRADDAIIAISNYRLHIKFKDSVINVPLRLIESVESRDMFQLHIICKDSKVVRECTVPSINCKPLQIVSVKTKIKKFICLFALAYHAWCLGASAADEDQHVHLCRPGDHVWQRFEMEVLRMGFDMQNAWRVSDINSNYKLCSSYPQKLLVPVWITDKELESVASFRSWKRIPVVVYRHQRNGAVIARCSQPEISWWGWRNTEDEYLVTSIAKACVQDPGARALSAPPSRPRADGSDTTDSDFDSSLTAGPGPDASRAQQKLLILDARSYTAAVANRAKGGGCECEEYYPNCEVMFMGMANIHSIRNSFQSLRSVCSQIPDPGNWLSALESTRWLQHLSVMLKAATLVCSAVERDGRPVLVHCSDGWDRTPQIVALSKILLDPYYRTIEGFQVLVETEWLDYGHKFGDRCGHQENSDDVSEQCPVFLQWLDCVHQLLKQFPCLFEFNEAFLVKLVQHTYSCLYGTFLCNNARERDAHNIYKRTCSVWSLLRTGNKNFQNFLYIPSHDMVLQPVCHTRALQLWTAVYLPTSSPCTAAEDAMELYLSPTAPGEELTSRSLDRLPKTRSMDNLLSACENGVPLTRTSSDPNLNKHCQDGQIEEQESGSRTPPRPPQEEELNDENCNTLKEYCLTLQPLASSDGTVQETPVASIPEDTPILSQAQALDSTPTLQPPLLEEESECRTADSTPPPGPDAQLPATSDGEELEQTKSDASPPAMVQPLRETTALPLLDTSTETLTEERVVAVPCTKKPIQDQCGPMEGERESGGELAQLGRADCARTARRLISQSQLSEFTLLGSHWDSMQGLVKSACNGEAGLCRAFQPSYQGRRLAGKLLRAQGMPLPSASSPPPPPPAYLDDDGLSVPTDAVQQRLRQIEAGYKQEVEVLRRQVRQLQMRLESKQYCAPPSEPDVDYEDDITCLRESDDSDEEDSLSDHSEDRFSEGSWDRVERKDTEVTRWVPDHMASHCFSCDSEFWIAKRRHHCRNCGNVFCKDCCHLKLPIPDQQLYDPVLVCNSCHDLLLESRTREIRSQQLKKPIATASS